MSIRVPGPFLILLTLLFFLLFSERRAILLSIEGELLLGRKACFGRRSVIRVVSLDVRDEWLASSPSTSNDVSALLFDLEVLLDGHGREAVTWTEHLLANLLAVSSRGQDGEWAKRLVTESALEWVHNIM